MAVNHTKRDVASVSQSPLRRCDLCYHVTLKEIRPLCLSISWRHGISACRLK